MRKRQCAKLITQSLVLATIYVVALSTAHGQASSLLEKDAINRSATSAVSICEDAAAPSSLKNALRQVCLRKPAGTVDFTIQKTIIIGFVGGFVKHDDARHPEVHFAACLRDRYPSRIDAEVFSNHDGQKALRQVLHLLDTDRDGALTAVEKERARIIIYGHSWGASETVTLARELGRNGIPVLLTIQVDTIAKPKQKGSIIPSNVANAVNFYQPGGLLHGRSELPAADRHGEDHWKLSQTYENHPINCDNYPWLARTFDKPHHEIENDPRVWDQAASLIDSALSGPASA